MKPTMTLPEALYSAEQLRTIEQQASIKGGLSGDTLMQRAGRFALEVLRARWPRAARVAIVCGPGNNGGDGFVLAQLARQQGCDIQVLTVGTTRHGGEAERALAAAVAAGVSCRPYTSGTLQGTDVIVDALLGTGLERDLAGEYRLVVRDINAAHRAVLALDVPSGLNSDNGRVMGDAVCANVTVCFVGLKAGLFTGAGRNHAGEICFHDLDIPANVFNGITPEARRITETSLRGLLTRRPRNAHKGDFGRLLVVGGAPGMPGAVRMCGEAAARAGAGMVTLATHPDHAAVVNAGRPELMAYGVRTRVQLKPLLARATVVALGPGLGRDAWGKRLFEAVLASKKKLVIDADGLYFFLPAVHQRLRDAVLTPHAGEAARLLGVGVEEIEADRFAAVRALCRRFGSVCVLKGAGTLIAAPEHPVYVCDRGNPGMASGGMGDVLTGVIAALCAQGLNALDAARLGVCVHAIAGDAAAEQGGEIGLLACDLLPDIRAELNRLSHEDA
jgi:NAD(P)H-hydrate epimerase